MTFKFIVRTPLSHAAVFVAAVSTSLLAAGGCDDGASPTVPASQDLTFAGDGTTEPLSVTQPERFYAVAVAPGGGVYAAGTLTSGTDQQILVARYLPDGSLDTSFSGDGYAVVNVAEGGRSGEVVRSIVVQPSGRVVVAGTAEHAPLASGDAGRDLDVVAVGLEPDGDLDPTFGDAGIARFDLSTGISVLDPGATTPRYLSDTAWGLAQRDDGSLILVAGKVSTEGGRADVDFAVLGLDVDGDPIGSFGSGGVVVVDVEHGRDSPRTAVVLPDGKVVVCGYTRSDASDAVVRPVLFRLETNGTLDASFGEGGLTSPALLPAAFEAYDVELQGDSLVVAGYGKAEAASKVDVVAARFAADGTLDTSFGLDGVVELDLAAEDDRGRDLLVRADGSIAIVGSGKRSAADADAMVVLLSPDGELDRALHGDGIFLTDFGGLADSFYGIAALPGGNDFVVAGYRGVDTSSQPGTNDDAVLVRFTR
ncbi:MAG: hypothetical protein U0230_10255 [Polyangiales bacterium]